MSLAAVEYKEFQFADTRVILDLRRNQLFQLDDISSRILHSLRNFPGTGETIIAGMAKNYPKEDVVEALDELEELGLIHPDEGESFEEETPQLPGIRALRLHLIHGCNLNCRYCYGKGGAYNTPGKSMSYSTAVKAVRFLFQQLPPESKGDICFFGGEPLLCWDLLKKIIPYIRRLEKEEKKKISLAVITNGTLLTAEVIRFLHRHRVEVLVSLDGPPHIHDSMRMYPNGTGSYSSILLGIKELLQVRKKCSVRTTLDPEKPRLTEIVDHLLQLGATFVYTEPRSSLLGGKTGGLSPRAVENLKQDYRRLKKKYIKNILTESRLLPLFDFIRILRMLKGSGQRKYYGCGMGRYYLALSPRGEFYPCHRFVDREEYLLGNLRDGISKEKKERFLDLHIQRRKGCRTCWARYLCGGGCYYDAAAHGDIRVPDPARCELKKEIITNAVEIGTYLGKISPGELEQMVERLEVASGHRENGEKIKKEVNEQDSLED